MQYLRKQFMEQDNNNIIDEQDSIDVFGARVHNLKNIDIRIPKKQTGSHHRHKRKREIIAC